MNRIHVLEEARHVTFARQEVVQSMAEAGFLAKHYHRALTAVVSYFVMLSLVNPKVYAAVGLDPKVARRAARASCCRCCAWPGRASAARCCWPRR